MLLGLLSGCGPQVPWQVGSAYGIFIPRPRIKPVSPALEADCQPLDHQKGPPPKTENLHVNPPTSSPSEFNTRGLLRRSSDEFLMKEGRWMDIRVFRKWGVSQAQETCIFSFQLYWAILIYWNLHIFNAHILMNFSTYMHLWNDQCNQSNEHIYHFLETCFFFFFFFFMVMLVKLSLCSLVLNRNAESFGWSGKEWLCGFARQRGRLMPSRLCVSPGGGSEESMKFKEQGAVNLWTLFWLVGGEVIRSQHHQPFAGVYMLVGSMQATSPTWGGFQYLQSSSKDMARNIYL